MSGTRVLVAGASIAGPALAHWSRRRGAEMTVVERAPESRPGGQAVDARGVAAKEVIKRMGLTPDILAHLDDTPDFYLDQVAQVVMDRWSSGRVGLLGDAAFSSSPMSGQGTGLALVGAYLLAGEPAAAGWDPGAGFARYEARMRSFVEANQEIGTRSARASAPRKPTGIAPFGG